MMMKTDEIIGRSVCLLLMSQDDRGEDDWAVVKGEIIFENGLPFFRNARTPQPFPLPDDTMRRIRTPTDDIREIVLNSDYFIPLPVGPIPKGESPESFMATGLKWPTQEERSGEPGAGGYGSPGAGSPSPQR